MCEHTSDQDTILSVYWVKGNCRDVNNEDIRGTSKTAASAFKYPEQRGISIDQIDMHSLQGGGANALRLSGYSDSDRQIMKVGCWRSKGVLEIHL